MDRAWCLWLSKPCSLWFWRRRDRRDTTWANLLIHASNALLHGAADGEYFGGHASLFFRLLSEQVTLDSMEFNQAFDQARRDRDAVFMARLSDVYVALRESPVEKEPQDKLNFFLLRHWDRAGAFDELELFYFTPDALAEICGEHFRQHNITTAAAINQRRRRLHLPSFPRYKFTVERRGGLLRSVPARRALKWP